MRHSRPSISAHKNPIVRLASGTIATGIMKKTGSMAGSSRPRSIFTLANFRLARRRKTQAYVVFGDGRSREVNDMLRTFAATVSDTE